MTMIDTTTAIGPTAFIGAAINDDPSDLSLEDALRFETWLDEVTEHGAWTMAGIDEESDPWFTWSYDLHGGTARGGEVCSFILMQTIH